MAAASVVGPPPGLEGVIPKKPSTTEPAAKTTSIVPREVKPIAPKSARYEIRFMLALSASPLVAPPDSMPALSQWYGDWEPYHFRGAQHTAQSHGLPHSPMGSIGSGARAERHGRNADGHRERERGTEDADGYYGGVMRDGGLTTSRREPGGRYRNRYDDRDGEMAPMRMADGGSKRFAPSGKNPFGQVSASGTFKPAGKDGSIEGQDKRFNLGRTARDRDLPPHAAGAPLDDRSRPRNGRELVTAPRDRRRGGGLEDGEDDEEWESVPKSPDNERRNRAGQQIDGAMEWRRAGAGKQGAKGSMTKEREREGGRKTSFPAWMAEESEPSWMSEGGQEDGNYQMGGGSGAGGHEGDIDVDVTGMDSIQAFKAQMKERERRERERNQGSSSALAAGPPPGLERKGAAEDSETKSDGMAALHSVGMNQQDRSAAALFDNFASSAKQRQQDKQQQQSPQDNHRDTSDQPDMSASEALANRAASSANPDNVVLPSRSSRFARFFDGKPQAAALAAQQKQMGGGADQSPSNAKKQASTLNDNGPNVMADLFKGLSTEKSATSTEAKEPSGPASPPGLHRNPSEADVQSMQKIMAMLGGGGGATHKGQEDNRSAEHETVFGRSGHPPGLPPALPPGIALGGGGGGQADRTSPTIHHSSQQAHSPTSPYRSGPPPSQHAPGSWANAVSNPGQPFDPRLGPYGGSPPGPGGQGAQFRPPFGMDPRLLNRGGPPPQGMPPQFAAGINGMPPMGRGIPPNFGIPSFGPGARPPPPPPLPPQLQQHLMNLPPQAQHQLLMQHFQHHATSAPQYGGPPQQQQQQQQQQAPPTHHLASPGLRHSGGHSPLPPFMSPSPATSNANQSAQLMALLGQGPGASTSQ